MSRRRLYVSEVGSRSSSGRLGSQRTRSSSWKLVASMSPWVLAQARVWATSSESGLPWTGPPNGSESGLATHQKGIERSVTQSRLYMLRVLLWSL